ncbi:amidohydrolase family protein [Cellvibrio fibrivorans]|uniref:Imidazolonepropionase-like amidohydrolase n=1 Tax=Cellvibrio fibrivorans TaxID=126350 RepID=A0ABU1UY82_9GAMM|nr:amidohydrolase family protein [Cellvibrio fibrivorans]MDR7090115.1 imidazolonepropionase-like amidohydrolase [Cellvibrio fibrivorans]
MIRILKQATLYLLVFILLLSALFAIGVLLPPATVEAVKTNAPIAIINTSVVDVAGGVILPNQTVIIERKKIRIVGAANNVAIPENAIRINGANQFLMPSLWDMHTHIFKVTPLLDLPLYIGYGVTNVRDMASCPKADDPFAACPEDFKRWTHQANNDELVGPRVQGISSWHLNGPGIHDQIKGLPEFFGTANEQQAREFVRYYSGKVDAIKVYNYISREAYFALVDEAKKVGIDVVGHRPLAISAIEAAQHQKSIEHARFILHESFAGSAALRESVAKGLWSEDRRRMLDEHEPQMATAIFSAMKNSGTWYVPTHLTRRVDAYGDEALILEDPILRYLHPLMKWQWLEDVNKVISEEPSPEARKTYRDFYHKGLELTGAAHRAEVKVLVGTDYIVAGITVHNELEQLVMAGLSPVDALRAATILPAEYFGLQKEYGSVAAGMNADLILLNKNPFEDIRNTQSIEAVIFNGNLYDRNKLDEISDTVESRAKSWSIACKILWEFIKNPAGY